jgi:predicted PurR-regulated permease PerM
MARGTTEAELGEQPVTVTTAGASPEREAVSWSMRVASEWAARAIVVAVAGYLVIRIIERVFLLSSAIVLALFLSAVLQPLVVRLRALGVPRSLAAALVLIAGVVVFGLVGWFVGYQISSHASTLGDQIIQVSNQTSDWLKTGPLHLHQADLDNAVANLQNVIREHQGQLLSGALQTAQTVLEFIGGLLLALLTTFFLLRDGEEIWTWVTQLFPKPAQRRVHAAGRNGWRTLGGYVRGLVIIAVIHAVTITIVLVILRVPLAPALGVLIFLGSFIPLLGLTISGAICVAITLLEHGLAAAIVVAIVIIVLLQVEGHLLQPLIMSRAVDVHPLAVALSVTAGTILGGIGGALVAVPLAAFTNSFVKSLKAPLAAVEHADFEGVPAADEEPADAGESTANSEPLEP